MDPQLSGKQWLIESWYKSAVTWASVGVWICTLRVVICIPLGFALGNTYNYTQGTNPIHPRSPHGTTITYILIHTYTHILTHIHTYHMYIQIYLHTAIHLCVHVSTCSSLVVSKLTCTQVLTHVHRAKSCVSLRGFIMNMRMQTHADMKMKMSTCKHNHA